MVPIALLPLAGLMLGLGSAFTNEALIANYGLESILGEGTFLNSFSSVMVDVGDVIFGNLALLFAISVAFGMAKEEKGVAALSAVVSYFTMYAAITSWIHNFRDMEALREVNGLLGSVLGFEETLNTGVFGGIVVGAFVAYLHNKYHRVEFPDALSFFEGTRFVPIISAIGGTLLGIFFAYAWPIVGGGIAWLGEMIAQSGAVGSFFYGYVYRALIPFGLHHVFYLPFWQTALGGTEIIAGQTIQGAQNIVFAQLANNIPVDPQHAKYFSFQFPLMIGGWPAAALAMYHAAPKERRDEIKGLLLGSSVTSILTGITEPIEFTVLFASPLLFYGVHSVLAGLAVVLVEWLGAGVGLTFSGGLTDFIIYGILPGDDMTNWTSLILPIVVWFVLYYAIFRFAIQKFDLATPGRQDAPGEATLTSKDEYRKEHGIGQEAQVSTSSLDSKEEVQAATILEGLGGLDNLEDFTNCATRLRVTVKDGDLVDESKFQQTGAAGVMHQDTSVQIIYGTTVGRVAGNLSDFINNNPEAAKATNQANAGSPAPEETESEGTDKVEESTLESEIIVAPMDGEAIELSDIDDEVFSSGMMGDGGAIIPANGKVYAPVNGEISVTMDSGHAVGFSSDQGAEVLVHVGLDTVELAGEGFKVHVEQGDRVSTGDLILEADLDLIEEKGYDTTTAVIVTNTADYSVVKEMATKEVHTGEEFLSVES